MFDVCHHVVGVQYVGCVGRPTSWPALTPTYTTYFTIFYYIIQSYIYIFCELVYKLFNICCFLFLFMEWEREGRVSCGVWERWEGQSWNRGGDSELYVGGILGPREMNTAVHKYTTHLLYKSGHSQVRLLWAGHGPSGRC